MKTNVLGFPRIGAKRELKKAVEAYWKNQSSLEELQNIAKNIRKENWKKQQSLGINMIPSNDFSYYDQVLDMSCLLGNIPARFNFSGDNVDLDTLFLVARGVSKEGDTGTFASEMTKWFDTNYHYIVPEFDDKTIFSISTEKIFNEYQEAKALGIDTKPVLIGPITYLSLGKSTKEGFNQFSLLDELLAVYKEILTKLADLGATWVQIDEPIFTNDLTIEQIDALKKSYEQLNQQPVKILLTSYFGELRENTDLYTNLGTDGLHFDAVRGRNELDSFLRKVPSNTLLSLGVVDGRNIWKNDYQDSIQIIEKTTKTINNDIVIAGSCSYLHSPVSLQSETKLDSEIKNWLAFADEKLQELIDLAQRNQANFTANSQALESRKTSTKIHNPSVKKRCNKVTIADSKRNNKFSIRQKAQKKELNLPLFPTTTIGSFPQTKEVRRQRSLNKKGELSSQDYDTYLKSEIEKSIKFQERIGIDMLVHGEFERNDMVEYFGEQLEGFVFTNFGWVQSYGSRCVKPPIIYGDVSRPEAMTVYWSQYAKSLTNKPMKGMLTGPVTILQWSFVRNDQARSETTKQIALAIRDEVKDLETAGIAAIQVDEPAFREGLPLRKSDWQEYLDWAGEAFRLSTSGIKDETQIHTHMCYCEFNDIIDSIAALDADVISIETSRSNMELLNSFVDFQYPNEIGPGVYDIHSPRIPTKNEMTDLIRKAKKLIPARNLWVNPDCGLKTRGWNETEKALISLVEAAKTLRIES